MDMASKNKTNVDALKHKDKRANIPTKELSDFVEDDEKNPETILYPRDLSLDPQLVWKGKDEQDRSDLEVQSVPIYIQEKIQPQAIIEEVRSQASKEDPEDQLQLFSDFNGIEFEDMVDFYHHDQNWTNRMILGDSSLVMTSLSEKEGLKRQVQMIYIDPPYGIKFGSNWQVSTRKRDVKDGSAGDLTRQPEQIKAFRDTWELGIHSYLTYLRDRFIVARELLTESGSVFVQISDENVHLVRCLLDEVFGSENECATIIWKKGTPTSNIIRNSFNYLLWYSKDIKEIKSRKLFLERSGIEGTTEDPKKLALWGEFDNKFIRQLTTEEKRNIIATSDRCKVFRADKVIERGQDEERRFEIYLEGEYYIPKNGYCWRGDTEQITRLLKCDRMLKTKKGYGYKFYIHDFPVIELTNLWDDTAGRIQDMIYVVQTNYKIIERCILMTTDPGDLVIDPTCGSGTTAYIAEQWGRRWITIDTSRIAIALARTRLMSARYPYYTLSDSPDGVKKESEITGQIPSSSTPKTMNDIKKGFVYKRVPHITLKAIANNPEIDVIHAKWHEKLEPIRNRINQMLRQSYEDWQIPRDVDNKWSEEAKTLHNQWWQFRSDKQNEINNSIARNADMEILYDQPYEENKKVRVTGPFTVESLSPHRVISTDEERPTSESEGERQSDTGQFETMIIDNLRRSGVQNTIKNERLKFDMLESYAGAYIQAEGEYTENDKVKRVAVCIGPEHGTVDPELVKESAKEAIHGIGFDLLIICGFAFDPHVSEETKHYGKLPILITRMDRDLQMGEGLLKKTGAGNLFMVFGEPDITVNKQQDGNIVITINGLDVYDPTTGQIRSNSTDDIACWFIDTNYNEEGFFVRHAYFCGAGEPYKQLQRALKAEIDEAAWSQLYTHQ